MLHQFRNLGSRSTSFTQRLTWNLWSKFLYEDLQTALSSPQNKNPGVNLPDLTPLLLSIAKVWGVSKVDPVMGAAFAVNSAYLLWQCGDYRSSITALKEVPKYTKITLI